MMKIDKIKEILDRTIKVTAFDARDAQLHNTKDAATQIQALFEEEKREIFGEIAQNCPLCSGLGEIISRKARQMGYTLADGETLDEKLIPCPLCEKVQALKSRFSKGE